MMNHLLQRWLLFLLLGFLIGHYALAPAIEALR